MSRRMVRKRVCVEVKKDGEGERRGCVKVKKESERRQWSTQRHSGVGAVVKVKTKPSLFFS